MQFGSHPTHVSRRCAFQKPLVLAFPVLIFPAPELQVSPCPRPADHYMINNHISRVSTRFVLAGQSTYRLGPWLPNLIRAPADVMHYGDPTHPHTASTIYAFLLHRSTACFFPRSSAPAIRRVSVTGSPVRQRKRSCRTTKIFPYPPVPGSSANRRQSSAVRRSASLFCSKETITSCEYVPLCTVVLRRN